MNLRLAFAASLLLLAGLAPPAAAQSAVSGKLRIFANGLWNVSKLEWDATRAYTEYSEASAVNSSYSVDGGIGFEAGARYDFMKHLGASASVAFRSGDASVAYDAAVPHPFFYDRKRGVSGEESGFSYNETSEHVGLVVFTSSGKIDLALTAGVAFFQVEAEQVDLVQYRHEYPYDTATPTGVSRFTSKDSPVGFSVAGTADYRVSQHIAIGLVARYSGATAKLEQADQQSTAELTVGGFQVGAGVRFIF